MCTHVRVSAVIGFSLKTKRCVSGWRLLKVREMLLEKSDSELLADVSFSSIKKLVEIHPSSLTIHYSKGTFGVCKKKDGEDDKLFDDSYHKKCYLSEHASNLYSLLNDTLSDI